MHTVLKLFLLTVFLCMVYSETHVYQLPDYDAVKSLNVTIYYQPGYQDINIQCNNYNSLKYLDLRTGYRDVPFMLGSNKFTFFDCFNNQTDNENYNFNLMEVVQKYMRYNTHHRYDPWTWQSTTFSLVPFAIVDSDVLFGNYFSRNHRVVYFNDVGLTNTNFLNKIQCLRCNFENTNQLDFNNFNGKLNMQLLHISKSKIMNLNSDNMRKLNTLTTLRINTFSLDDYNTFNVPGLFEHQNELNELYLIKSDGKIVFHDDVFRGLRNVEYIILEHLQLDSIPPNLFNDMESLKNIRLNSNNIKVLPSTIFEFNLNLKEVELRVNPIFSVPHDTIDQLVIGGNMVSFYFGNYTIYSRDTVITLMKNERIEKLYFQSLETDFKIQDFMNMDYNRTQYISIEFFSYPSGYINWTYLNSNGIAQQKAVNKRYELDDKINVQINLPVRDEACQDCWMIKKFFYAFLDFNNLPGFYFDHSRTLLQFLNDCPNEQEYFDEEYTTNCIPACKCKYNSLADQIIIDCRNRNITEFPIIPYPAQFDYDKIYTFDLFFENNLLREISFDGQDERVLQKIATLDFSNNRIESITMMNNEFNTVDHLNLCTNPMLKKSVDERVTVRLYSNNYGYNEEFCAHNGPDFKVRLPPNEYISETKSADAINQYLNKLNCV